MSLYNKKNWEILNVLPCSHLLINKLADVLEWLLILQALFFLAHASVVRHCSIGGQISFSRLWLVSRVQWHMSGLTSVGRTLTGGNIYWRKAIMKLFFPWGPYSWLSDKNLGEKFPRSFFCCSVESKKQKPQILFHPIYAHFIFSKKTLFFSLCQSYLRRCSFFFFFFLVLELQGFLVLKSITQEEFKRINGDLFISARSWLSCSLQCAQQVSLLFYCRMTQQDSGVTSEVWKALLRFSYY